MRLVLGIAVVTLLIFLAVIGGSAEHSTGTAELRRGPASIVVSVLITLALLAGVFSLALLFWGLVTRHRRSLDTSAPQRHSPILVAGALLAIFAGLAALLALAARGRRSPPVAGLGAARFSRRRVGRKGLAVQCRCILRDPRASSSAPSPSSWSSACCARWAGAEAFAGCTCCPPTSKRGRCAPRRRAPARGAQC